MVDYSLQLGINFAVSANWQCAAPAKASKSIPAHVQKTSEITVLSPRGGFHTPVFGKIWHGACSVERVGGGLPNRKESRDMGPRNFYSAVVTAIGLFCAIEAAAGTISYSGTSTAPGTNSFVSLALPKFDASLGTLDSVTVNVDFARVSGTFSVGATTATAATVNDDPTPAVRITIRQDASNSLGFTQIGAANYDFSVSQTLPFTVPGNSSQVFDVIQNDVIANNSQSIGSGSFSSYASPGGSGTIIFEVRNNPVINISGGTFALDAATVLLETAMTVTYAYTPVPVPEPSTWAMAAAGAGLVGLIRWRRRAAASARIG